jgi:YebC/PmpR family DNA-binding regulatory protein
MRHYFDKYGGNLGQTGCVSFMFEKKGVILIEKDGKVDEDTLMMEALDAGAEDMNVEEEYYEILTGPNEFSAVREALENKGYSFLEAEISMIPATTTTLTDPKQIEQMEKLVDMLEDHDDVQNVFHNCEQEE